MTQIHLEEQNRAHLTDTETCHHCDRNISFSKQQVAAERIHKLPAQIKSLQWPHFTAL